MRILIADDDPGIRYMLEDTLQEWGFETEVVSDGREALAILQEESAPEIALLDWLMPEMSGVEVCEQLKTTSKVPFLYIIVVTIRSHTQDVITALNAGASDYVTKPIDVFELRSRIDVGVRTVGYKNKLLKSNKRLDVYASTMEQLATQRAEHLFHAERLAMLGTMTASVAHELSNPLFFLSVYFDMLNERRSLIDEALQLLVEKQTENEEAVRETIERLPEILDSMQTSIDRTLKLLSGLKRFSRKEADSARVCDVNDSIVQAVALCAPRLSPNIAITHELDHELPKASIVSLELEQVLMNLFINASDAMEAQDSGTLIIRTRQEGDQIVVDVEDNGPGVPKDRQETIWDPFFTTKGEEKGTGLGLSICKDIIGQADGVIEFIPRAAQGAHFRLSIPVVKE